eukprot:TRINITY_DN6386_c0_g1_i3.p1 TRINITY_DN6386_c0_g1~~TRINITY_DN6386_c0_g1_i3.p1  ORF type:complete len:284 (-),score=65.05 TRINITY_DN6386_c0_g1_i3:328-1179(-)
MILYPSNLVCYKNEKSKHARFQISLNNCEIKLKASKHHPNKCYLISHTQKGKGIYSPVGPRGERLRLPRHKDVCRVLFSSEAEALEWKEQIGIAISSAPETQTTHPIFEENEAQIFSDSEGSDEEDSSQGSSEDGEEENQSYDGEKNTMVTRLKSNTISTFTTPSTDGEPSVQSNRPVPSLLGLQNRSPIQPTTPTEHIPPPPTPSSHPMNSTPVQPPQSTLSPSTSSSSVNMVTNSNPNDLYFDGWIQIKQRRHWLKRWVVVRKGLMVIFLREESSDCFCSD